MTTLYYCEIFKLPSEWVKKKRHLIRVIIMLDDELRIKIYSLCF